MPKLSDNLPDCRIPTLKWLRQMGCTYVIFQGTDEVDTGGKGYWTKEDVLPHKRNCEEMGMSSGIDDDPHRFLQESPLRTGRPRPGDRQRAEDDSSHRRCGSAHDGMAFLARFLLG